MNRRASLNNQTKTGFEREEKSSLSKKDNDIPSMDRSATYIIESENEEETIELEPKVEIKPKQKKKSIAIFFLVIKLCKFSNLISDIYLSLSNKPLTKNFCIAITITTGGNIANIAVLNIVGQ